MTRALGVPLNNYLSAVVFYFFESATDYTSFLHLMHSENFSYKSRYFRFFFSGETLISWILDILKKDSFAWFIYYINRLKVLLVFEMDWHILLYLLRILELNFLVFFFCFSLVFWFKFFCFFYASIDIEFMFFFFFKWI